MKLKTRLTSFQRSYTHNIRLTCYLFFQKSKNMIKIGIIGGSGFYQLSDLKDSSEKIVDTEFGPPSDKLVEGTIYGVPVVVLARHGQGHKFNPSQVNYRANIRALWQAGCTHILATTCCGSLRDDYPPGTLVVLDSFIDRTTKRSQTFHDQESRNQSPDFGTVCHIPMHPSFCPKTSEIIVQAAQEANLENVIKEKGTIVTVEGPRFSSRAESFMFKSWKADVLSMTTCPEVVLAKEAGISYASIAMVTDYDCWKDDIEPVDAQHVLKVMGANVENVKKLLVESIRLMAKVDWADVIKKNKDVATNNVITK